MAHDDLIRLNRRGLLKSGAGIAAAVAGESLFVGKAFAAAGPPEVKGARLGFIALTDAAPLIIAKELGLFAKYGMPDVVLAKQASWGATRDNLVLGSGAGGIDGAHILTPMCYFLTLGVQARQTPMSTTTPTSPTPRPARMATLGDSWRSTKRTTITVARGVKALMSPASTEETCVSP